MATNFLEAAGNSGFLSPAVGTGTGNTHTNTTVDTLNFNPQTSNGGSSAIKGSYVQIGAGGHAPDILASVTSSTAITILTATSTTATGTAVSIYNYPILVGGEASALTNGSALLSSYWNNTGFVRLADFQQALEADIWFESGGAFTPTAGGYIAGWFIPSIDGGTTFENDALSTPSATVFALPRSPDFIIALDAVAHAAGNIRFAQGRTIAEPPSTGFKTKIQNLSGATMPSTWLIGMGPRTPQY